MSRTLALAFVGFASTAGAALAQFNFAFDTARQRVIDFGTIIRVWEAPASWRVLSNSGMGGPPQSVFDPVQNRVIAIYGSQDLWIWDGAEWSSWGRIPSGLYATFLAWDTVRNRLVVLDPGYPPQTWEWSDAGAVGPLPAIGNGSLQIARVVFDPASQQVLAYGFGSAAPGQQTWLWNGTVWTLAAAGVGPSTSAVRMAGDPVRRRLLCHANTDLWEWDGVTWTRVGTNGPSTRDYRGMVYDPTVGMPLLFGYEQFSVGVAAWTGSAWIQIAPPSRPSYALTGMTAYDPARDRLVMFGGSATGTARIVVDDTWTWTGTDWLLTAPATRPPGRDGHAMEYHAPSQRVVLFGGRDAGGTLLGDTWLWDGVNWSAVPIPGPAPRRATSLAYEGARGTCLLFGGEGAGTPAELADTWEWNGASWLLRQPTQSPPARIAPALAHDTVRGRTVMTGGTASGTTVFSDTWEWDGGNWQSRNSSPPAPGSTALAYHARRNRILATGAGPQVFEWDGVSWTVANIQAQRAFKDYDSRRGTLVAPCLLYSSCYLESPTLTYPVAGPGCGGTAGSPGLTTTGWPVLGDPWFGFEMTSPLPRTPVVLGLSSASSSLPLGSGCDWQLGGAVALHFQLTDARAFARWPWNIRVDPNLVGIDFHAQGVALDPAAPLGFGLTNHLHFTIGL